MNAVYRRTAQTRSALCTVSLYVCVRQNGVCDTAASHSALRPDSAFSASRRRLSSSRAAWVSGCGMVRRRRDQARCRPRIRHRAPQALLPHLRRSYRNSRRHGCTSSKPPAPPTPRAPHPECAAPPRANAAESHGTGAAAARRGLARTTRWACGRDVDELDRGRALAALREEHGLEARLRGGRCGEMWGDTGRCGEM